MTRRFFRAIIEKSYRQSAVSRQIVSLIAEG